MREVRAVYAYRRCRYQVEGSLQFLHLHLKFFSTSHYNPFPPILTIAMTSCEMTSAFDYFTCLPKYRVVICKTCRYCVWPDNARTRLREKHSRLLKAERALICDELQAWQGVSLSHEQFEIPKAVDQPGTGSTSIPIREAMSTRA